MRPRSPRGLAFVMMLAMVSAGAGAMAGPVSAAPFKFSPLPWLQGALDTFDMLGGQSIVDAVYGPSTISGGSDGRITILLLGSDYRQRLAGTGERTDSIIFMTIDNSDRISAISLPRDVADVPIAPGVTFKSKVNGLFKYFKKQSGGDRNTALAKVEKAFDYAFGIQIDYVAFIRFTALERFVQNIGGVEVNVPYTIEDPSIFDERQVLQPGAKFLAGPTNELGANAPPCYTVGHPINWAATPDCTRALEYVRSRHGAGNSDWKRDKRQQGFIYAAMQDIKASQIYGLLASAQSNSQDFYTNLPMTQSDVLYMYNRVHNATMPNQAVLQPPTYASNVPGTSHQVLKLSVVRALFKSWFGPLN